MKENSHFRHFVQMILQRVVPVQVFVVVAAAASPAVVALQIAGVDKEVVVAGSYWEYCSTDEQPYSRYYLGRLPFVDNSRWLKLFQNEI